MQGILGHGMMMAYGDDDESVSLENGKFKALLAPLNLRPQGFSHTILPLPLYPR